MNKLKYDNGDVQILPKAILAYKYSQLSDLYKECCKQLSYQPLSESTLWNILHVIKPNINLWQDWMKLLQMQ